MRLSELAAHVSAASLQGDRDPEVDGVSYDSRSVPPGSIFVAVTGFKADGHDYLKQVLDSGAAALALQADREANWLSLLGKSRTSALIVPDTRAALPRIAAALAGFPARRLRMIGVTGTDGKTSLSHLLHHVLSSADEKAGLISTAECWVGDQVLPDTGRFTTPEAPEVQQMLSQMEEAACRWAVIEATSHGLTLHRVDECDFDIAVFTNLYPDHIDFHQTFEGYVNAKGRLFSMLDSAVHKGLEKAAVLNGDDPSCERFRSLTRARIITYGFHSGADVIAEEIAPAGWGSRFLLRGFGEERRACIAMPGDFNIYNALAAYAVGQAAGLDPGATIAALETWPGAPGRMELVDAAQPFTVLVDFAHAPESLRRVLMLMRERSRGRIILVFGCIGERDKDRRFRMGQVAAESADYTIVTDDNPYSEDRDAVNDEIARGLREAGKREGHDFAVIPDRREAIEHAIGMAVDGDAVLLAGKGHEREVHLPDSTYLCHDPSVAREVLLDLGYAH
jgi:UDP-N-acetylmuramoyl-L-alanyl-D-glutamate--2,6-diaminopimelate ligase